MECGSLNLLEPSGPHRACYGTALPLHLALMAIYNRHESIEIINLLKLANNNNNNNNNNKFEFICLIHRVSCVLSFIQLGPNVLHFTVSEAQYGHYTALRGMKIFSFDLRIVQNLNDEKYYKNITSLNELYSFHYFTIISLLNATVVEKIRKLHFT
jgi:hypothetical protein